MKYLAPFLICFVLALTASAANRPNILFIIADDQSPFDLGVTGVPPVNMIASVRCSR